VPEDDLKRRKDKGYALVFIINGQDFPLHADPRSPLAIAVQRVLSESGNTGRPPEEWEVRDAGGVLLETNRTPDELKLRNGARLFVSLKVGAGGIGKN
jgi:Protein of Unknown function (DUF2604)